jgi:flagellar basal-body rod protein FlgC
MTPPIPPTPPTPAVRPMFRALGIAASGLTAQRMRMETIATNIANAETTHTEGGGPYRRRVVQMEGAAGAFTTALQDANGAPGEVRKGDPATIAAVATKAVLATVAGSDETAVDDNRPMGVKVTAITEDPSEGPLVYDPGHPDANADGYVRYPNVRVTDEMVNLMDARRLFEANATVFQSAKAMLRRAIDI